MLNKHFYGIHNQEKKEKNCQPIRVVILSYLKGTITRPSRTALKPHITIESLMRSTYDKIHLEDKGV